jgi:hypothetical protein
MTKLSIESTPRSPRHAGAPRIVVALLLPTLMPLVASSAAPAGLPLTSFITPETNSILAPDICLPSTRAISRHFEKRPARL